MAPRKPAEAGAAEVEPVAPDVVDPVVAPPAGPVEDVEGVEVVLNISITGLRDGEEWPKPGESITLPADEAAAYIANGYATAVE